ncbi:MAG TPA: hypothetical protein GX525_05505 [Bacilli bacterium]|nr:hypothetical protein [Bacilli bacterium]
MRRKNWFTIIIVIVLIAIALLFWLSKQERSLNYDDYEEMESLSEKSLIELQNEGYSDFEIEKIKEFNHNYQNHLTLLDIVENDKLKNYGFNNRSLTNEGNNRLVYDEDDFTILNSHLSFDTAILDLVKAGEGVDRDGARVLIEFEWNHKPNTKKHWINLAYPNYVCDNIYSLLKYENPNDQQDVVYKMAEIDPYNFIEGFYTEFDSNKKIHQENYVLKSGILVLDIKSYYADSGVASLSITSQYGTKSFFRNKEILSEKKIVNVEKETQN